MPSNAYPPNAVGEGEAVKGNGVFVSVGVTGVFVNVIVGVGVMEGVSVGVNVVVAVNVGVCEGVRVMVGVNVLGWKGVNEIVGLGVWVCEEVGVMVLVTMRGVALGVSEGVKVTGAVFVTVGVDVTARLSGARERAMKPAQ